MGKRGPICTMEADYNENVARFANGARKEMAGVLENLIFKQHSGTGQRVWLRKESSLDGIHAEIRAMLKNVHFEVHKKLGLVCN